MPDQSPGASLHLDCPWLTIWTHPRETIRAIAQSDPGRHVLLLVAMAGFCNGLSPAFYGGDSGQVLDLAIVLFTDVATSVAAGVFWFLVFSWLAHRAGMWLDGIASVSQLRAAMAWPNLIWIAIGVVWIAELAIYGRELFLSQVISPALDTILLVNFWLSAAALLGFVLLTTICVSEVQRFSLGKAFASAGLMYLLIGAVSASLYWHS